MYQIFPWKCFYIFLNYYFNIFYLSSRIFETLYDFKLIMKYYLSVNNSISNEKGLLNLYSKILHNKCILNYCYIPINCVKYLSYLLYDLGYSHGSPAGLPQYQDDIARDLYEMLTQWFKLFYQYQSNPFYVFGESYAGKYIIIGFFVTY